MGSVQNSQEVAKLQFLKWTDSYLKETPFETYLVDSSVPGNKPETNLTFEEKNVPVNDIRNHERDFELDKHGFMIRNFSKGAALCSVDQKLNDMAVRKLYYPAVEDFLKSQVDGVDKVYPFDWRVRDAKSPPSEENETTVCDIADREMVLKPTTRAHIDQSPDTSVDILRSLLPNDAEFLLKGRVRLLNVWLPLYHEVNDWPLAVCDGSSISPEHDLVKVDFVQGSHKGANIYLLPRDKHKWYFIRNQQIDEAFVFKIFDTATVDAKCCPHGSFRQDVISPDTIPRKSLEVRTFVFTYPSLKE